MTNERDAPAGPLSRLVVDCGAAVGRGAAAPAVMVEQRPTAGSAPSHGAAEEAGLWDHLTGTRCDDWHRYQVTATATSVGRAAALQQRLRALGNAPVSSATGAPRGGGGGWSVAVWFSAWASDGGPSPREIPLVSLARPRIGGGATDDDGPWTGCPGYDLELAYRAAGAANRSEAAQWVLRYRDSDDANTCRTVRVPLDGAATHHIVASWTPDSLQLFHQGRRAVSTPLWPRFDVTLSGWDPDNVLQVLRRPTGKADDGGGSGGGGGGDDGASAAIRSAPAGVHQIEFYAEALNSSRVRTLFRQGFARTLHAKSDAVVVLHPQVPSAVAVPQDAVAPASFAVGGTVQWNRDLSVVSDEGGSGVLALAVRLASLPRHGNLTVAGNSSSSLTRTNDREFWLPLPLVNVTHASAVLLYTLQDRDFFNLPSLSNRSTSEEEAVQVNMSIVWDGQVLTSTSVSVPIQVQQVNHPPRLTAPDVLSATESTVYIRNITLIDPDAFTTVRVDVTAGSSLLSLQQPLDANAPCRRRTDSPWLCVGDGVDDRTLTFVAPTAAVDSVLDNLRVQLLQGGGDNVTVRVCDGVLGDCLSAQEHALYGDPYTVHRDCRCAGATIQIRHGGAFRPSGSGSPNAANVSRVAKLLFWGLTLSAALAVVACLRRGLVRCLARGHRRGAIDADDGPACSRNKSDTGTAVNDSPENKRENRDAPSTESDNDWDSDDCASF